MTFEKLDNYMNEVFDELALQSPLFYNTPIGIRFELGLRYREIDLEDYLECVNARARIIFEDIFSDNSSIIIVTQSYRNVDLENNIDLGIEVIPKFLNNECLIEKIEERIVREVRDDENILEGLSYEKILECQKEDINYIDVIRAISNMDHAVNPYSYDRVFFINKELNIIFYMYDDRGVDVVSNNVESLIKFYQKHNSWILEYDRARIDAVFCNES